MRILYYGVFDGKTWRAEYPILEGFQQQGLTVWTSNFRSHWPWRITGDWKKYRHQTDLIFIQNGIPFPPRHMQLFDKPVVYFASEFALSSHLHLMDCPRRPDFVLAHSAQNYEWCQAHHLPVQRVHHASNPHFYKRLDIPYQYDICFIGGMTPRRKRILDFLRAQGIDIYVTQSWQPEEVNRIYNQSRLVLHIHAQEETYLPTRLFEVIPTQSCFLIEDMGTNFDPNLGQDFFASWQDPQDLLVHIRDLLAHPEKRAAITAKANALAPQHTWLKRTEDFVNVFEQLLQSP